MFIITIKLCDLNSYFIAKGGVYLVKNANIFPISHDSNFGERLSALKNFHNIKSIRKLAEKIFYSLESYEKTDNPSTNEATIESIRKRIDSQIKNNNPKMEYIKEYCDVLGCSADYLLGIIDFPTKDSESTYKYLGLNYETTEKIEKYPSEIKKLLNRLILSQTGDNLLKLLKSINNYAVYGHNVFLELYDVSIDSRNTELEDEFEIPVIDKEQSKEVLKRASTSVMQQVLDDAYDNYIPDSNLRLKERLSVRCKKEKEQFLNLSECPQVSSLSKEERIKLGEWTNWGELSNDEALKKIEQKYQSRYKMYVETVPKKKKEK